MSAGRLRPLCRNELTSGTESPRLSRRLQLLRGWSHEHESKVFPRSPRARSSAGPGAPRRVQLVVGGGRLDQRQDWLHARDPATVGAPGRARPWPAAWPDDQRSRTDQAARARDPRVAPGQRDPAQSVGVFCPGGDRPPMRAVKAFIDEHGAVYGVEPICKVLPFSRSTYYEHVSRQSDPERWHGALAAGRGLAS